MGKHKRQVFLKATGSNQAKSSLSILAVLIFGLRVPLISFRHAMNMSYIICCIIICDTYHIINIEKLQAYP